MFKVKQKISSILVACLAALFAFVLAIGVFSVMPKVTANAATTVTDTLNRETTGATSTNYITWSGKTDSSGAVYAGQSAGGNESIQLRSNNSNSGIVTTKSAGVVKSITVGWHSNTASGRKIDIYGKNTAYTQATDLYSTSTQGTKLGSIAKGSTTLNITGSYEYIGIRSNSGALYLTSITIIWETASTEPECVHNGETKWVYDDKTNEHFEQCVSCDAEIENTRAACADFVYSDYTTNNGTHTRTLTCEVCGGNQTENGTCSTTTWSDWTPNNGSHVATGECDACKTEISKEEPCEINAAYERNGNEHTKIGTCEKCGASTSVTDPCTLTTDGYKALDTDNKETQQHAVTTTCSVCQKTETTNEPCSFDEGVLDGTTLTYTCKHCKYSYTEEATMHEVKYVVPNKDEQIDPVNVAYGYTTLLPSVENYQKYTFVGWVTEKLENDTDTAPTYLKANAEYTVTEDVTFYALYSYTESSAETWNLVTDVGSLAVGKEIVIAASGSNVALSTTQNTNNRGQAAITKSNDTITFGDDVQIITLEAGTVADTFAFNVGTGYLYAASSSANHLKTQETNNANGSWKIEISSAGVATIKAQGTYTRNWLRKNSSSALFACYESGQNDVSIYMKSGGMTTYYATPIPTEGEHSHSYDEGVVTAPTCTEQGYTTYTCGCGDTYKDNYVNATGHSYVGEITKGATCSTAGEKTFTCSACEDAYTEGIPANGHQFENGVCTTCGEKQAWNATLTFDDEAKRTAYSDTKQVWKENGITVTNNKSSSTTNIADYSNPVRFYKNSTVTIEYPGMLVIVIKSGTGEYLTALQDTIKDITDATVTVNGSTVTLEFAEAKDFYTLTCAGQIRIYSITAYTKIAKIDQATITVGKNITLNYYVTILDKYKGAKMHFTVEDKVYTVEGIETGKDYVFSLEIPPQHIASNVKAELIYNDTVIASKAEYSVKTYVQNQLDKIAEVEGELTKTQEALKQLLTDLLYYGNAAYNYKNETSGKTPATDGVKNIGDPSQVEPTETDFTLVKNEEISEYPAYFTGAGVNFDSENKIYVKVNTTENVTVTVKIDNGETKTLTFTDKRGCTESIQATGFADTYTFVLSYDGVVMQTLTYSVNAYAYAMKDNATMGNLALALYRYGVSAQAYANPKTEADN